MKNKTKLIYVIGSLKNRGIMNLAVRLRKKFPKVDFFCGWTSVGPRADEYLVEHAKIRGLNYRQTLALPEADLAFNFDLDHIDQADAGLLVMPCGKSGWAEGGYMRGQGKPVWALFPGQPERFDLMTKFFSDLAFSERELIATLKKAL